MDNADEEDLMSPSGNVAAWKRIRLKCRQEAINTGIIITQRAALFHVMDYVLSLPYHQYGIYNRPMNPLYWDEMAWSHLGQEALADVVNDPSDEICFATLEVLLTSFETVPSTWIQSRMNEFYLDETKVDISFTRRYRGRAATKIKAVLGVLNKDSPESALVRRRIASYHSIEAIEFVEVNDELVSLISSVQKYYSWSTGGRESLFRYLYRPRQIKSKLVVNEIVESSSSNAKRTKVAEGITIRSF